MYGMGKLPDTLTKITYFQLIEIYNIDKCL